MFALLPFIQWANREIRRANIALVETYDGYRAWFSFVELAIGAKENPALLVWEENGKPIPDNETPFRRQHCNLKLLATSENLVFCWVRGHLARLSADRQAFFNKMRARRPRTQGFSELAY